ncbi:hypothetical protein CEXT_481641 [Caerostris extrusa]|uniref:Uncharacterized protein n=1 Tax=Caerostris extrusa TaxID=172846 RepID=A0AAV4VL18_CAEEX|nr:hypothetical protein CEXT_481641 [Caerostris extrusa]
MTAQSSSSLASYDPSICSSSSHGSSMKFHVVLVSSLLVLGSLAYDSSGFKDLETFRNLEFLYCRVLNGIRKKPGMIMLPENLVCFICIRLSDISSGLPT